MRQERVTAAIGVPVRNEEILLPALLGALAALDRNDVALSVCCFLDGCTDGSEAILRAADLPFAMTIVRGPATDRDNAGRARHAAMVAALDGLGDESLLLSTDADSRPRADWVQATRRALTVSDVVAGRIVRDGAGDPMQARVERYFDRLHALRRSIDPVAWEEGGCHHAGGANIAMGAGVYRSLGGFAPIAAGEDALLLDEAARAGLRVRHDPAMVVATSARRDGRATGGLAANLAALDRRIMPRVQHPAAAVWQYERHAAARAVFGRIDDAVARSRFAASVGLRGDHVLGSSRDCPNAEAFAMRIVPAAPDAKHLVSLAEAEQALDALTAPPMPWCGMSIGAALADVIAAAGWRTAPARDPESAATYLALLGVLYETGRRDLPLGRLLEGHTDAAQIVTRYGTDEQRAALNAAIGAGAMLGVWNAAMPGEPLRLDGERLMGGKSYASGAGVLTHALVTADTPQGPQLLLLDLARTVPAIDRDWWRVTGMQRSETHQLRWIDAPVAPGDLIGAPGDYAHEPWFSGGALRFVAVHAGGVAGLFDRVRDHLVAADRAANPFQAARLAELYGLAETASGAVRRTAGAWFVTEGEARLARVAAARVQVTDAAERALAVAQAAVGLPGQFLSHPLAAQIADLQVYLRQPAPDAQRLRVGRAAATGLLAPAL